MTEVERERMDRLEEALRRIAEWADAYPLPALPEPDGPYLSSAQAALLAAGLPGIDAISASAARLVTTQVGRIARAALEEAQ